MDFSTLRTQIEDTLKSQLRLTLFHLENESHLHAHHPQRPPDMFHVALTIGSPDLDNLSRVAQHKLIYKILAQFLATKVHALKINVVKH